jgi:hypothetical protein
MRQTVANAPMCHYLGLTPFFSAALKGRPMIAQGKAQRRPGFACPEYSQALKGQHNPGVRLGSGMGPVCSALTGLEMVWAGEPRTLPWAGILRPVEAGKRARSANQSEPVAQIRLFIRRQT